MDQIRQLELENMKSDLPSFNAGDTVDVHYLIREGDKERIQIFSGTVIKIAGTGVRRTFLCVAWYQAKAWNEPSPCTARA